MKQILTLFLMMLAINLYGQIETTLNVFEEIEYASECYTMDARRSLI